MPFDPSAFSGVAGAVAASVAVRYMLKRLRPDTPIISLSGGTTLSYPPLYEGIGWVGFIFFLVLFVAASFSAKPDERPFCLVTFGGFSVLSALMIVWRRRAKIEYDESGVTYHPLFASAYRVEWMSVTSIDYSRVSQWWRLRTTDGRCIRVSLMMNGHRDFLDRLHLATGLSVPESHMKLP